MIIKAYRTYKIKIGDDLFKILDKYLPTLKENSVVAVTSKIISICQGDIVKNDGTISKDKLVKKEADLYYTDKNLESFGVLIPGIKDNVLIANAGIDESNSDGNFVLWPRNINKTIEKIWNYLKIKNKITNLGVIVTDSTFFPLRQGSIGVGISWCGFDVLKDYRGKKDIFGKELQMSKLNLLDGLSASAVLLMGEGAEQTPIAIITDIPFVIFQNRPPTEKERDNLKISKKDDMYGKLLNSVKWKKGERSKK